LKIINQSGEHLLELIDDILSLAQIEAGRLQLNLLIFELNSFLEDIQTMFKLQTDTKNIWLRFEVDPNLPTPIKTDAKKLRQVLINLINNGIKFTEQGGVTVRVKFVGVEVQEKSAPADKNTQILRLQFEVEDTGVGIDPKELDKLFQAFMQTETGIKSKQGTGLGLAISREFVQLMGGEMTVQSQVGQGSLFQFYIQALPGQPSEVETLPRNRKVVAIAPGQRKYKILVVDDRWSNRQLLVKLLKPLGFEVQEAENGKVAVELWES
jgi:signal transduction histidine kinase